jgi:uncharacterized protein YndB with AHSA1/START domain
MDEASRKPDYVAVTFIAATEAAVWAALTDPAVAAGYFGAPVEIGSAVGEQFIVRHAAHLLDGKILEYEPPRRLKVMWSFPADPPPDEVTFLIDPAGEGVTRLSVHEYHGRAWATAVVASGIYGWGVMLSAIKTYSETGKPLPPVNLEISV